MTTAQILQLRQPKPMPEPREFVVSWYCEESDTHCEFWVKAHDAEGAKARASSTYDVPKSELTVVEWVK